MQNATIKRLTKEELDRALLLVWRVFLTFEAPDYPAEGVEEFQKTIRDESFLSSLEAYGAFLDDELVGMIATRESGRHISLFFVDAFHQRRGIGKKLFQAVRLPEMTVNSSPYAVPIYEALGFKRVSEEKCVNGIRFIQMILRPALLSEARKEGEKSILCCHERKEWRAWLESHFESEREVWFVFPNVASGEAGVSYNDAVEEALCFGWIDGQAGTLDKMHQLRRFTPRRKGSPYSQPNIERLILMDKMGLIHPKVRANEEVEKAISTPFVFPADILDAIRADEMAWKNYQSFSDSYKRIRIAYIDAARKRPDEFQKRLKNFIDKTRDNKKIMGYGGVDKYYL